MVELAQSEVEFAVVGGLAVILNGYPRLTLDAAIIVDDSPSNIRKMLDCLSKWGEGWARELSEADFKAQEGLIRVMEEFDLDIFTRMQSHSFADFRPRLRFLSSGGTRIPFIGPEDLIRLKDGSWREKDQLDVQAMREILRRESGES